jgi:hypothetical protein
MHCGSCKIMKASVNFCIIGQLTPISHYIKAITKQVIRKTKIAKLKAVHDPEKQAKIPSM